MLTGPSSLSYFWSTPSSAFLVRASLCAYSASVRIARVPNFGSRCRGTPSSSVLGHIPWRSGSPQAVLEGVQDWAAAAAPDFVEADGPDCPGEGIAIAPATAKKMMYFGNPRRAMAVGISTNGFTVAAQAPARA